MGGQIAAMWGVDIADAGALIFAGVLTGAFVAVQFAFVPIFAILAFLLFVRSQHAAESAHAR